MLKCDPKVLEYVEEPTHVVSCDEFVLKAFASEDEAKADAEDRNKRAEQLGIDARYAVNPISEVGK